MTCRAWVWNIIAAHSPSVRPGVRMYRIRAAPKSMT